MFKCKLLLRVLLGQAPGNYPGESGTSRQMSCQEFENIWASLGLRRGRRHSNPTQSGQSPGRVWGWVEQIFRGCFLLESWTQEDLVSRAHRETREA